MQITPHVFNMHIDDGATSHPGGSNNFFVGDPSDEMVLIDTGDYERRWTRNILDYYQELVLIHFCSVLNKHDILAFFPTINVYDAHSTLFGTLAPISQLCSILATHRHIMVLPLG